MTSRRVLCVIARPRTGSTQLQRVLASFDRIVSYGEIFHPNAAFSLKPVIPAIAFRAGIELAPEVRDPTTVDFVRTHPRVVLDTLLDAARPSQVVSFNLFPGHLTPELTDELLARPDVAAFVLRRRVIDSYASNLKATAHNNWTGIDTTTTSVKGDADQFAKYVSHNRKWYERCVQTARRHGNPVAPITYETDIAPGESVTLERLRTALADLGIDAGDTSTPIRSLARQDRSMGPDEKFENWPEFEAELRRRGLHDAAFGHLV